LAKVAIQRGDRSRSERLLDEVEARASSIDDEPLLAGRIAEGRALGRFLTNDLVGAAGAFEQAAALYGRAPGDQRVEVARMLANAGNLRARAGDHARADEALRRAQQLFEVRLGPRNVQTASAGHNRALALFEAGRAAEAKPLLQQALAQYRDILDPDHPRVFQALLLQGRIDHRLGDPALAARHFREARAMAIRLYPEGALSYQAGDASFYRARALSDAGDHAGALAEAALAKAAYDARYGPDDTDQVELMQVRAQILRAAGQTGDSLAACDAALALRRRLDRGDPELPAAQQRCAALALDPPGMPLRFEVARSAAAPSANMDMPPTNKALAR
jgi:tetratricopeptide (TPR) repeat protein